ncbi:MAG: hypothetical protein Q7V53_03750 [Caldisericota bacterium]|nr:hypothetical protein [Caldisericota bacterium]
MRRLLTNLIIVVVVFVVFALIVSPLRTEPINITILFFPTIETSAEALAYVSLALGFLLAAVLSFFNELALRRRCRDLLAEQRKQPAVPPTDSKQQEKAPPAQ